MFVLVHNETGKYVAEPGQDKSYTQRLEEAQTFSTREEAERNRCDQSERIAAVDSLLRKPQGGVA
jgi:hypothetical protein